MAGYFKRRARAGPSKNDKKVRRGQDAANRSRLAGVLSQRYSSLERLSVELQFLSPQKQVLDRKTLVFGPSDVCDFSVPCPGRCGVGSFDLAAKIKAVIEAREAISESSGTCQQPLYAGSPNVCGLELKCRIEARFAPLPVTPT